MKSYDNSRIRFLKAGLKLALIVSLLSYPMLLNSGCASSNDGFVSVHKPKTRKKHYNPKKHRRAKRVRKVKMKN